MMEGPPKPPYEPPRAIPLGELAAGSARGCNSGTGATGRCTFGVNVSGAGNCKFGTIAAGQCAQGGTIS